ncbi:MAG: hypothetical protein GHCLOJNM_01763 [bacterium]|nr:hypothetical protein [bacterium]
MMPNDEVYTWDDPIVEETRRAGADLFREAGSDLHTFCEKLREAEREHPERIVHPGAPMATKD